MKKAMVLLLVLVVCLSMLLTGCTSDGEKKVPEEFYVITSQTFRDLKYGEIFVTEYTYDDVAYLSNEMVIIGGVATDQGVYSHPVSWLYTLEGNAVSIRDYHKDETYATTYADDLVYLFDDTLAGLRCREDFWKLEKETGLDDYENYTVWYRDGSRAECAIKDGKVLYLERYSSEGDLEVKMKYNSQQFLLEQSYYNPDGTEYMRFDYEYEMCEFELKKETE